MGLVRSLLGLRLLTDALKDAVDTPAPDDEPKGGIEQAVNELVVDGSTWTFAGDVTVAPDGSVWLPELPPIPGIRRRDVLGPDGSHGVGLAEAADLSQAMEIESDEDRAMLAEMGAQVVAGYTIRFSYLDTFIADGRPLKLHSKSRRKVVMRSVNRRAEAVGVWDVPQS